MISQQLSKHITIYNVTNFRIATMKSENVSFQPKHVLLYFNIQYRNKYLITAMQQNSQNFHTSASELQKVN